ncbi:MAG: type II toxin-antitoxin system HicA family toxin [Candidatus Sulfotelmatobacter sp.]|jgi:predicted RNA binding protein YcfA (HicA-like mRNA interferase family)
MAFSQEVWNQIRATTADELIAALEADGYHKDPASRDATVAYIRYGHPTSDRVVIHYHPGKTYRPKLLLALLAAAGWTTEEHLIRVGLVKKKKKKGVIIPTVLVACSCNNGLTAAGTPCPDCGGTRFKEVPSK